MDLNDEQCKHLATTLRNLGFGALIPVALKIYGSRIDATVVVIWSLSAFWLEMLALFILKGVNSD